MAGAVVTWGVLAAWCVHDTEELLTMAPWSARRLPVLRERMPRVPERFWRAVGVSSTAEAAVAVGAVGLVVVAAAAAGAATGGRSVFFQAVLAGFGLHTIFHAATAVITRGYTPGVVTAVVVAAPFSAWAWSRLAAEGLTGSFSASDAAVAVALAVAVISAARAAGRVTTGRGPAVPER